MSSVSFRKDAFHFIHESDNSNGDVKFHTSNNFDMKKPIKCSTYVINDTFKVIENGGSLIFQKKIGDTYVTRFTVD